MTTWKSSLRLQKFLRERIVRVSLRREVREERREVRRVQRQVLTETEWEVRL